MRVIAFRMLREFYEAGHPDAENPLRSWYDLTEKASWTQFADIRRDLPSADLVGERVVFNICGNRYRLIVLVDFERHGVLVRFIGTHAEYDRVDPRTV